MQHMFLYLHFKVCPKALLQTVSLQAVYMQPLLIEHHAMLTSILFNALTVDQKPEWQNI